MLLLLYIVYSNIMLLVLTLNISIISTIVDYISTIVYRHILIQCITQAASSSVHFNYA